MRINKYLSSAGIVSRRGADEWIEDGRITINGELAELGSRVSDEDDVRADGKPVKVVKELVYIVLNKPVGITSTTESHIKGNVVDFVNHPLRVFHIGRLDKDSNGLLLLTNDGDIVNEILREEHGHEKEYIVSVDKPINQKFVDDMEAGVAILDTVTKPCTVKRLGPNKFNITLTQGLNRQIRRMCTTLGYTVKSLQRTRILNIHLGDLPIGKWRDLTELELTELFEMTGYKPKR